MVLLENLTLIKAFAFDVDGVMTDGSLLLTDEGQYLRIFNIRDGYAIRRAINQGYKIVVISGGKSEGVKKRLQDLGVQDVYLGKDDKAPVLIEWLEKENILQTELAYMGDDILDMNAMNLCAIKGCPQDAVPEVKNIANYISPYKGGQGCLRDFIELVLKAQNRWLS